MKSLSSAIIALSIANSSGAFSQDRGIVFVNTINTTAHALLIVPESPDQPARLVLAGHQSREVGSNIFYFSAFDQDGFPVHSFGNNSEYRPEPQSELFRSINTLTCIDSKCSRIAAGGYQLSNGRYDIALLCITRNGTHCPSFGEQENGQTITNINSQSAEITSLLRINAENDSQTSSYLLAAGYCYSTVTSEFANTCLMPFNNNGTARLDDNGQWYISRSLSSRYDQLNDIILDGNKVVGVGFSNSDDPETEKRDLTIARFNLSDYSSDTADFIAGQGYSLLDLNESGYDDEEGMTVEKISYDDGQTEYIVAGQRRFSFEGETAKPRSLIGKFNSTGAWDAEFYRNFQNSKPETIDEKSGTVNSLLIHSPSGKRSDTRIYAAGEINNDIALWCVYPDGNHCEDFVHSGVQSVDINNQTDSAQALQAITLKESGEQRLLVAGYGTPNNTRHGVLMRFLMDGRLDLCFGQKKLATELLLDALPENYTLTGEVYTDETALSSNPLVIISNSTSGSPVEQFAFNESSRFNLSNVTAGNYTVELYQCGRLLSSEDINYPQPYVADGAFRAVSSSSVMIVGIGLLTALLR